MNDRKLLLLLGSVIFYCLYSVHMWFLTSNPNEKLRSPDEKTVDIDVQPEVKQQNNTRALKIVKTKKVIPLYVKNGCSILEIFTQKHKIDEKKIIKKEFVQDNTITVIGITVFLVILVINAALDIIKVKEEEKLRLKLNPDGERRKSLSEFANKKSLRRESSKFGLQLCQIAESVMGKNEDGKSNRESRPYTRGDSINSYLSEKKPSVDSAPASIGETPTENRLAKRQSVAKLFGARPAPMVRRSSTPALPLNPEIQAIMLGGRQASLDSDDEDGKGRRVRIIRRY